VWADRGLSDFSTFIPCVQVPLLWLLGSLVIKVNDALYKAIKVKLMDLFSPRVGCSCNVVEAASRLERDYCSDAL